MKTAVRLRWLVLAGYLGAAALIMVLLGQRLGREIFPSVDAGQLQIRFRAPTGTHVDGTEEIALQALNLIAGEVGSNNVRTTLAFVGVHGASYPINLVYLWNGGPEEGVLQIQLSPGTSSGSENLKESLRRLFAERLPNVSFSFEPSDIVSRVMSLGSPTPIEIAVSGASLPVNREFAEKIKQRLLKITSLRDVQFGQAQDYPTVDVNVDRERAGLTGIEMADVSRSLVAATSSSRFVVPNYWADPNSGVAYQIQVQVPPAKMNSLEEVKNVPINGRNGEGVLLRNIARITEGTTVGQYERYNMQRMITITANLAGVDLGRVSHEIAKSIEDLGDPPPKVNVAIRGQILPMRQMMDGLRSGLVIAVIVIFLLLAANFQSLKLSLAVVSTVPAVGAGVVLALWLTQTSLNIQSFIGAIMAVGVAVANAILLVTFAERNRMSGAEAGAAAVEGAQSRLRPILMTGLAMIVGMLPLAIGFGEGGQQTAPLGRAVVGGLVLATLATLLVLPTVFAIIQDGAHRRSASLDPDDPNATYPP